MCLKKLCTKNFRKRNQLHQRLKTFTQIIQTQLLKVNLTIEKKVDVWRHFFLSLSFVLLFSFFFSFLSEQFNLNIYFVFDFDRRHRVFQYTLDITNEKITLSGQFNFVSKPKDKQRLKKKTIFFLKTKKNPYSMYSCHRKPPSFVTL